MAQLSPVCPFNHARMYNKKKVAVMTHVIEPNAAGIDVGSTEMFVAVPVDRDPQPVRRLQHSQKTLSD